MHDPYLILGVTAEAGDEAIHQAYLESIRRCPPDQDPERFQALHAAYETLKTRKRRLHYELFNTDPPSPEAIFERACPSSLPGRPSGELFAALLREQANPCIPKPKNG
jgi:curved DNA-binding protein CbpA